MKIFQFQSRIFDLVQKWVDQKDQVVFEKFRKNAWKTMIGFLVVHLNLINKQF